jgi:two-component system, OmpR family, sensor histidine kinase MtrB
MKSPLRRVGLRVRLVATFALGALILCLVLAIASFTVTRGYLLNQRERTAERAAQSHADAIVDGLSTRGAAVASVLGALRLSDGTQSLLHYRGQWYTSAVGIGPDDLPSDLRRLVVAGAGEHQRIALGGGPVVVIGLPMRPIDAQYYEIASLNELNSTLRTLSGVLVIVAAIVTLFGAAAGLWTSQRLLRPLTRLADTSREIAGGRLDARMGSSPDRQLAVLSSAFNDMADALQQRIDREVRFTADVSHELRSPLTTVYTALSVLEGRREELSERSRAALNLLSSEVQRFGQLVEDLLEISRIDAGAAAELESVCLAQIVLRAERLTAITPTVQIEVDAEVMNACIRGDKRRLERIIVNLLDNAGRYASSSVCIGLDRLGPVLRLWVEDDGPGILAGDRERVFDRFYRASAGGRRGEGGGAGLGLALVRETVRVHGGLICVEDSTLGGARFVASFPLNDSRQEPTAGEDERLPGFGQQGL